MNVIIDDNNILDYFPYLEVSSDVSDHGKSIVIHKQLPIYLGSFENNNTEVDILIACSDLQGVVETNNGNTRLLGSELPEFLRLLVDLELSADKNLNIGVLLSGDLYTDLVKRGGSGDVKDVWNAFKKEFNWVVGVSGNHDYFGLESEFEAFKSLDGINHLEQDAIKIEGLTIGGISGIIGRADKKNRLEEKIYLKTLDRLLAKNLDIILLHETPDFPQYELMGNPKIRDVINKGFKSTIFCGHCYWNKTIVNFETGSKVINIDSKAVILVNKSKRLDS